MVRTIVTAPGSLGDVNPLMAIARGLQARGHEVIVATAERYLPLVERAGMQGRMLVPESRFAEVAGNPDVWHPRKGLRIILQALGIDQLREHYGWLHQNVVPGETILIGHMLDFAGRIYRDAHPAIPFCSVLPEPVLLRSLAAPPQMTPLGFEQRFPKWLMRVFYRYADSLIDRLIGPTLNQLRREHQLPPVRRFLDRWWASPDLTLGTFDAWMAVPELDWPSNFVCTGFPLEDAGDLLAEPARQLVERALAPLDGESPIVFAPGSAHAHARAFLSAGVEACRALNRACVLLSPVAEQFPSHLPAKVVTSGYLPFGELMQHACAIVHHGGIGTTSQSLAAGLPQVVCPMAFDEFDNGSRVQREGVARLVPMTKVSASRLQLALEHLLNDASVRGAVRRCQERVLNARATPRSLAALIESRLLG